MSYRQPGSAVANDSIYLSGLRFIEENPHFWEMFEKFAFQMIRSGRRRCSSKLIFERIRWETSLTKPDDESFKINNNYSSIFARFFVEKYPAYSDFFSMRSRPAEKKEEVLNDHKKHKRNLIHAEGLNSYE